MFEAYVTTEVASKLEKSVEVVSIAADSNPLQTYLLRNFLINIITAHAKKVYLGSKTGHLLSLTGLRGGRRGYDLSICRSFEKKAVTALQIVPEHGIILCLSDGQFSAHDIIHPFGLKATLTDVKPVTSFSTYINEEDNFLYVALSARKKIYFYKWFVDEFSSVAVNLSPAYLCDIPQLIVWCGPIVALAAANEYYFFNFSLLSDEVVEVKKLFSLGSRAGDPLIVDFKEEKLVAYCKDDFLVFQDYDGAASPVSKIKFSVSPLEIVYDAPYVVALLPKGKIEIRSVKPSMHIQTLQLTKASHLAKAMPGTVYAGSSGDVWLLDSHPHMKENVERLVREKHFELAIHLAEKCENIDKDGVIEIKRKAAFNLFCQRRFDEWLELHTEAKTDVMTVIAHFPCLLDSAYRASLSSLLDEPLPDFAENERKSGLLALSRYLAAVRTEHAKIIADYKKSMASDTPKALKKEDISHHEMVLKVVDTTLLKCYLQANENLVASLMRLPDNMCILEDSEQILIEKEKFYELYLLYKNRGHHRKALTLLKEHSHDPDSLLTGCEMTVRYLQHLDNSNLDLIFTYAPWVFHEDFDAGFSVFTYDDDEARNLDRDRVLQFLTRECVPAIIPYLEHIIYELHEKRPKFHEALGSHYISQVKRLMKEYISALKDDEVIVRAGEEEGELGEYRRKLAYFLKVSDSYSAEKLLVQLRNDSLYEERAMLLGRLKKHEQALAIYTNVLKDYKAAENYCSTHYDRNDPENSKVWLILLRMYTYPPDRSVLGLMQKDFYYSEPNQVEAIRILKDHANSIDTGNVLTYSIIVEALSLLPPNFPLRNVWNALEAILQAAHAKKTSVSFSFLLSYNFRLPLNNSSLILIYPFSIQI
ncbi:unnamed protein product [Enterobius vermicularis]|uniref:CNH domain-containing protein n=1 Tax=Enterobius vermicularis TaxID=51028 RepID=A0A158Q9B0_ENTVE|nr:unnamed protein product [Enterobius vermicularis]